MKFKFKTLIVLLILTLGMGLSTVNVQTTQAQGETAKLGLLTPLTGELGPLGPTFENGANLAIKDLNAMQDDYTFELIVQDTEGADEPAASAMTALADEGVSGVVGAAASGATLSAIEVAKANRIPMVSYASTSPAITDADDGDFLFRVVPTDAFQGVALAELVSSAGISSVAMIALDNAYGQGLAASFENNFEGDVVTTSSYPSDQDDFSSVVSNVKASDAEAVVMISYNEDGAAILDELANQDVNLPLYGADGIKSPEVFNLVSDEANYVGMEGSAPIVENNTQFFNDFVAEYNTTPSIFVPQSYDATMILGQALIEAGDTTACEVANEIRTVGTDYDGVSGTVTFDSNGDQVAASYEFWEAEAGGTFAQTDTFTPTGSGGASGDVPDDHCASEDEGLPLNSASIFLGLAFVAVATVTLRKRKA